MLQEILSNMVQNIFRILYPWHWPLLVYLGNQRIKDEKIVHSWLPVTSNLEIELIVIKKNSLINLLLQDQADQRNALWFIVK